MTKKSSRASMPRRAFIALFGGAVAAPVWSFAAGAQSADTPANSANPAVPVIGFLHRGLAGANESLLGAFQEGLKQSGYIDGENVAIAYQWTNDGSDQWQALAGELVRSQVGVLVAAGHAPALAAKAATNTIPVVFIIGEDPVKLGLVASLARPGGNVTGVDIITSELTAKRLALLRALVPDATHVAVLVDPSDAANAEATVSSADTAAHWMGLQIRVLNAGTADEIDAAFETIKNERLEALYVEAIPFFNAQRVQLINLAESYSVPAIYGGRQAPESGGLISYGASLGDAYRQAGVYTARILKGESPVDMPVVRPAKVELVINLKAAKKLGIAVPPDLLAQANDVIE